MHRCLKGMAPSYLTEGICWAADISSCHYLCSSAIAALIVPPICWSVLGNWAFPITASWVLLPAIPTLSFLVFRQELKTLLHLSSLILLSSLFCLHCVNCLCNIHVTVHYSQFVICSSSSSLVLLFNNIALEQTGQFSVGWHMVWSSCSSIYLHYEKLVFIFCTLRKALIVFVAKITGLADYKNTNRYC